MACDSQVILNLKVILTLHRCFSKRFLMVYVVCITFKIQPFIVVMIDITQRSTSTFPYNKGQVDFKLPIEKNACFFQEVHFKMMPCFTLN